MFGFGAAQRYYATQSASRYLDSIRVPALVVQARDDCFIPFAAFAHPAFERNPHLRLLATEHGGHVGFISRGAPRLWLERILVEWLENPS
jgi:predicted alpha/beta-fold hydrolase